jgi:hypothetical protein
VLDDTTQFAPPGWNLGYQGRAQCAGLCLAMLISFAGVLPDPVGLVSQLPSGDHQMQAVYRLIVDKGRVDEPAFAGAARSICEQITEGSERTLLRREICLYHLDQAALRDEPAKLRRIPQILRWLRSGATFLAYIIAHQPDDTLALLDANVQDEIDLPMLFGLYEEAHTWQSMLLGKLYTRMFDSAPLSVEEARELCQYALLAVESLPKSVHKEECLLVYRAIAAWLEGNTPELPSTLPVPEGAIHKSHLAALKLLQRAEAELANNTDPAWLDDAMRESEGWWDSERYSLEDGALRAWGMKNYVIYPFPAVRLATLAIAMRYDRSV